MLIEQIDFNEELLYRQIADMYRSRSTESIAPLCTTLQRNAFQREIDILNKYHLYKDLQFVLNRKEDQRPRSAINQRYDGKVLTNYIVTSGKTKEIYRNPRQRKKHQRKTKNAFLTANVLKSNLLTAYSATGEVHCNNCGAPMEHMVIAFTVLTVDRPMPLKRFDIFYLASRLRMQPEVCQKSGMFGTDDYSGTFVLFWCHSPRHFC